VLVVRSHDGDEIDALARGKPFSFSIISAWEP
jgi:hypothetical protein